jgi:hypothetical protein
MSVGQMIFDQETGAIFVSPRGMKMTFQHDNISLEKFGVSVQSFAKNLPLSHRQ